MANYKPRVKPMPEEVDGKLTVWGMFVRQYKPKRLLGKSKDTTRLYANTIRKFGRFLGRAAMLDDLTDDAVSAHLAAQAEIVSMPTVQKEYCQLVAMWRFAARRKLVDAFPDIARPDACDPVPECFSTDQMQRLLTTIKALDGDVGTIPAALFWESLVRIIYDSGERIGAVLKIERQHIQGDWLLVPGDHRKGKREGKRFRLSSQTVTLLRQVMASHADSQVLPWPYCRNYLWKKYQKVLLAAGLPAGRRDKFHRLRRTTATYFEAAGGDATKLLGHSARRVTQRYIDERFITAVQPCDLLPPLE